MRCVFLVPRDLPGPSGGTHYNHAVIAALRDQRHTVQVLGVPGAWPHPSSGDRDAFAEALYGPDPVVVDGIMALAAPHEVQVAVESGATVHVLIHSLLTAEPRSDEDRRQLASMEQSALHAATSTSCASQWSASDVGHRYPGIRPHVLVPGTTPSPLAHGSTPRQLLVLAALTPLKNQLLVLRALSRLLDKPWTLQLVGSAEIDPGYAAQLRRFASAHFGPERVVFHGALTGGALEKLWDSTDLLLLTSLSETFGMVVTEALARGIPAIVAVGTGAVDALLGSSGSASPTQPDQPGAVVDPHRVEQLTQSLEDWLSQPEIRAAWRTAAVCRRPSLQTWADTAAGLVRILQP